MHKKCISNQIDNFESTQKYLEVSDQIKKVTFNTDFFDKQMFEGRQGRAFHFNSGKLGKFIECEFEKPVRICRSRLLPAKSNLKDTAKPTFVI